LPSELTYHIVRLAASSDYRTAHACALVSKTVCRWTRQDRWKTIIIKRPSQFAKLFRILQTCKDADARSLSNKESGCDKLGWEAGSPFFSTPHPFPGRFVANLMIDATQHEPENDVDPQDHSSLHELARSLGDEDTMAAMRSFLRFVPFVDYLALGDDEMNFLILTGVSPRRLLCTYFGQESSGMLTLMKPAIPLALHWRRCDRNHLIHARSSRISDIREGDHTPSTCPFWIPSLGHFRRRLKSVHVIGIDPKSHLTGIPVPSFVLNSLRSGSTALPSLLTGIVDWQGEQTGPLLPIVSADRLDEQSLDDAIGVAGRIRQHPGWLQQFQSLICRQSGCSKKGGKCADEQCRQEVFPVVDEYSGVSPRFMDDVSQGATALRYDTRKFALRPCEITARRLTPFFQELTSVRSQQPASSGERGFASSEPSLAAAFAHTGPRHAAPPRGAGNPVVQNRAAQNGHASTSREQDLLRVLGVDQFRSLELCWDARPSTADAHTDANKFMERFSTTKASASDQRSKREEQTSDWPMERQDIWTNTSSINNEARAPPPHTSTRQSPNSFGPASRHSQPPGETTAKTASSSTWKLQSGDIPPSSKAFRADLIDAIRTELGWTEADQDQLFSAPPLKWIWNSSGRRADPRDEAALRAHLQELLGELSDRAKLHTPDWAGHATRPASTEPLPEIQLTMRPPIERLKLGGQYCPFTKQERVEWFLDHLDSDEA
ncbi:hypothetical protein BCV70DRAFT_147392, partial [Testicularia cyperi]